MYKWRADSLSYIVFQRVDIVFQLLKQYNHNALSANMGSIYQNGTHY